MRGLTILMLMLLVTSPLRGAEPSSASRLSVAESVDIEPVWSGHAVRFALLTHGEDQYVGYYDAQRRMSVAHRKIDQTRWTIHKLPLVTGWDSHNYIAMAVDEAGCLHVAGDMHGSELRYFRMTRPGDVTSLTRFTQMVGDREDRAVTYPVFIQLPGADGRLIFRYRYGSSGAGDDIYNIYAPAPGNSAGPGPAHGLGPAPAPGPGGQWRRLVDGPVVSGEGEMNAYCSTPTLGPDRWFHMVWVWRDTGDAATCHDLSYAKSRDLVKWETSQGEPLTLPITLATSDIVDPIPVRGGLINNNPQLGFDSRGRPLIVYSKYDATGKSQVYLARPRPRPRKDGANGPRAESPWLIRQLSQWTYRREFGGGGTLSGEGRIDLGTPHVVAEYPDCIAVDYSYPWGRGAFIVREATLEPVLVTAQHQRITGAEDERLPIRSLPGAGTPMPAIHVPASLLQVESEFPGMQKRFEVDSGEAPDGRRYILTWETLPPNRDRPRPQPWPEPSMLRVIQDAHP